MVLKWLEDIKVNTHFELEAISFSFSGLTRTATLMLHGCCSPASPSAAEIDDVANDDTAEGPVRRLNGDFLAGDLLAKTETAFAEMGSPAPDRRLLGKAPRGFMVVLRLGYKPETSGNEKLKGRQLNQNNL